VIAWRIEKQITADRTMSDFGRPLFAWLALNLRVVEGRESVDTTNAVKRDFQLNESSRSSVKKLGC
jgi:hypothetical protein